MWQFWNSLKKRQEELEIRERDEAIPTEALLRSARILSRVKEILEDVLSLSL